MFQSVYVSRSCTVSGENTFLLQQIKDFHLKLMNKIHHREKQSAPADFLFSFSYLLALISSLLRVTELPPSYLTVMFDFVLLG